MTTEWLKWVQAIEAIAQTGLTYSENPFDRERYQKLRLIGAEIAAEYTELELAAIVDLFSREEGYPTPKIDVRAAVFRNEKILLVKEKNDGCWSLPGGWADIGDSPSEAIVREVKEESGYDTKAVKLLAVYDRSRHDHPPLVHYAYKLFFHCQLLDGPNDSLEDNTEIEAANFFDLEELPPLSLSRVTPKQISRLFEHYHHPEWPTDFD